MNNINKLIKELEIHIKKYEIFFSNSFSNNYIEKVIKGTESILIEHITLGSKYDDYILIKEDNILKKNEIILFLNLYFYLLFYKQFYIKYKNKFYLELQIDYEKGDFANNQIFLPKLFYIVGEKNIELINEFKTSNEKLSDLIYTYETISFINNMKLFKVFNRNQIYNGEEINTFIINC